MENSEPFYVVDDKKNLIHQLHAVLRRVTYLEKKNDSFKRFFYSKMNKIKTIETNEYETETNEKNENDINELKSNYINLYKEYDTLNVNVHMYFVFGILTSFILERFIDLF
jgi:hypothetical protein